MSLSTSQRRSKFVENLESRRLFSGTVTVVGGATPIITGDDANNQIDVTTGAGGTLVISGKNGTLINGFSQFTTVPVTGGVAINMNGGKDVLTVHDVNVPAQISVRMGGGNDQATFSNVKLGKFFHFEGGADNDDLTITNMHVTDPSDAFFSSIDMDPSPSGPGGDDHVTITQFFDQDLAINLGGGNDTLSMSDSTLANAPSQRLIINGGDGNDQITLSSVKLAGGSPGVLRVIAGSGQEVIQVYNCTAYQAQFVNQGGHHALILSGDTFGSLSVDPGFFGSTAGQFVSQTQST